MPTIKYSDRPWTKHFEVFCSSEDLSLDELQRMTEGVTLDNLRGSSFLHRVCMNKNVTLGMVEYLLDLFPQALHYNMRMEINYEDDGIACSYPLHLACYNDQCSNEVIRLLFEKITQAKSFFQFTHISHMSYDWGNTGIEVQYVGELYGGTPLHFYLSRTANFDIDIVKQLEVNPEIMLLTDEDTYCTPIHILLHNKSIGDMYDVVKYLVETNPDSLLRKDEYDQTPLNAACTNGRMTLKTIELLLRICPDSIHVPNNCSWLPIHTLCDNDGGKLNDEVAIDILKLLLEAQPDLVTRVSDYDGNEELPIHHAANNKSKSFCKILVDAYPESIRIGRGSSAGSLPFHNACKNGRIETVEYLFGLYPEGLYIRDNRGYLPIHEAANNPGENAIKIINFLIRHDPECISKPVVSDDEGSAYVQGNGALPLHVVCDARDTSNLTELLFDLYPEAILTRNGQGQLPIDVIREKLEFRQSMNFSVDRETKLIPFLQTQTSYARKAQDETAMRTPDFTGSLPLHHAIRYKAPLGAIKLLVKGNPDAVAVLDGSVRHPLDIACWCSTVNVVKYLAELIPDRLNACDVNKNYRLHHACQGGNCEVISYLLETSMSSSISERNINCKLPIHLFCEHVRCCHGHDPPEYTETIWRLLTAYPETVLNW